MPDLVTNPDGRVGWRVGCVGLLLVALCSCAPEPPPQTEDASPPPSDAAQDSDGRSGQDPGEDGGVAPEGWNAVGSLSPAHGLMESGRFELVGGLTVPGTPGTQSSARGDRFELRGGFAARSGGGDR